MQHCFPVYGGGLEAQGVEGLLTAYRDCLGNILLSGPTLFGPLIGAASNIAASNNCRQDRQKYDILLILTDGVINDLESTIGAIVAASGQPLSIIIIGIGNADFTAMDQLDSDKTMLQSSNGTKASRDIVQFVSFKEHTSSTASELAACVLAEVPRQMLQYMEQKGIRPNPPLQQPLQQAIP